MKAEGIRFIRTILEGNEIRGIRGAENKLLHREINVLPGTTLDKMGISRIYCDKYNSFSANHSFTGDRYIFATNKDGVQRGIGDIKRDNYEESFKALGRFFRTLYDFRH